MVDSLSLPSATSFVTQTSGAVATAAVLEFATSPPPAVLAAGGVIAATVVGSDGVGVLTLRTDFGTVALKTLLTLDPGTAVELKLFAGPPSGAAILSADGTPLSFGTLRAVAGAPTPAVATLAAEEAPTVIEL